MAQQESLRRTPPDRGLDFGPGERSPEAGGGEAVGEAPAHGDGGAVGPGPPLEVVGERDRALSIPLGGRVVAEPESVGGGVHQPVGLERHRHVVVDVLERTVHVPVVTGPVALDEVERPLCRLAVERRVDPFQAERDEDAEELPVVLDGLVLEDPVQPLDEVAACVVVESFPGVFRAEGEREADRRLLDHPLVCVSSDGSPVVGVGGIGAVRQAVGDAVPVREVIAADGHRDGAVERPCEPLELGRRLLEASGEAAEADPGTARRGVRDERFVEIDDGACHVVTGGQRVARQGVGSGIAHRRSCRIARFAFASVTRWGMSL